MRSFLNYFSYYEFLEIIDLIEEFRGDLCTFNCGIHSNRFFISVHNGFKTCFVKLTIVRNKDEYKAYDKDNFFLFEFRNFEELRAYLKHIS